MRVYSNNIVDIAQFEKQSAQQQKEIDKLKQSVKIQFIVLAISMIVQVTSLALYFSK